MYDLNLPINIRSVQHYLYCPHRWGLIEIGDAWAENYFVVKANLQHNRVHSSDNSYRIRGKRVLTSVTVWNDYPQYDLYGVTDCIELTQSKTGTLYQGEKYDFCIVEYKPTKPHDLDFRFEDAVQVYAQKLCVDAVFGCDCKGCLYYSDTNKRVVLPFSSQKIEYEKALQTVLSEIRQRMVEGVIPPVEKNQRCSGCSFYDMCMPKLKKNSSVYARILECAEDEDGE